MKPGSLKLLEPSGLVQGLFHIFFIIILCNEHLENSPVFEKFTGPNTLKLEAARLSETVAR